MHLVIDASVACKWYLKEDDSDQALALLDGEELLIAPALLLAEVGNVLWQRLRKGQIPQRQADEIALRLPDVFLALVETRELFIEALAIARELDHAIYDCFYLAVARRWEAPLVTADESLLSKLNRTAWQSRAVQLRNYRSST